MGDMLCGAARCGKIREQREDEREQQQTTKVAWGAGVLGKKRL